MDVESRNTIGLLAPQGVVHMSVMAYWYQSSCQAAGLRMLSRLGTYHTLEREKNVKPMRLRYDNCRRCMSRTWPCGYTINMSVGRIQYVCVLAAPLCRCAMWRLCPGYHRPTTHHISLLDPPPLNPPPLTPHNQLWGVPHHRSRLFSFVSRVTASLVLPTTHRLCSQL